MKKLSRDEILGKLEKVVGRGNQVDLLDSDNDVWRINGKFSSVELSQIAIVMNECLKGDPRKIRDIKFLLQLNVGGFTHKDIKVIWSVDDGEYDYSFYLMKDGKSYDFYYGKSDQGAGDWWPEPENEYYLSPICKFVPNGFVEACENMYEYRGTHEEALELFEELGYTVEHRQF